MKEVETSQGEMKNRRKLLAGIGIFSLFPILYTGLFRKRKPVISCAPPEEKKTMKMLSQNGQLVEVDMSQIESIQGKISIQELQTWIKRQ